MTKKSVARMLSMMSLSTMTIAQCEKLLTSLRDGVKVTTGHFLSAKT